MNFYRGRSGAASALLIFGAPFGAPFLRLFCARKSMPKNKKSLDSRKTRVVS